MTTKRDTYRSKVYAAERAAFDHAVEHPEWRTRIETVPEIQAYVNKLTNSAWFKRRWTLHNWRDNGRGAVTMKAGQGFRRAVAYPTSQTIYVPLWARKEWVICHELAHIVTPQSEPWHAWHFLQCYIELVNHVLGKEAAEALKAELKARRVPWRTPRGKVANFRRPQCKVNYERAKKKRVEPTTNGLSELLSF